jgi:hypothetical protein
MFQSTDPLVGPRADSDTISWVEFSGVLMVAVKGIFMEKWLCFGSMGVAGLLLLLFLLDVVLGFPFGGTSVVVDVFGVLVCGIVLYLAYDAFRDLR